MCSGHRSDRLVGLFQGIPLRTRVKICGITRREDALAAVAAGADAIGLVFCRASARAVDVAAAEAAVRDLPPFVQVVGLFVDAEPAEIRAVLERVRIDLLQFHGAERPEQCRHGRPYLKAIAMRDGVDVLAEQRRYHDACALLLDTHVAGQSGGTGQSFDWSRIPALTKPLVLAGGLTPGTVGAAVRQVRPYGVDVSGGVEQRKGIKDPEKIRGFIQQVRKADEEPR